MYKEAEEGLISEGRDANLNLRAVESNNQSANELQRNFTFSLASFVPGKYHPDAINHIWKTKAAKQKEKWRHSGF